MKQAWADIVIFGGGVAGLWLLNKLRSEGYATILFESGELGGGQTNKSQGIIHGGMKYVLQGKLTADAEALANVPALWRDCLLGKGEIDLSAVPLLADQHYLWAPNRFTAKLAGFLAGAALNSQVHRVVREDYPVLFQNEAFTGELYALNEFVIDVPVLIRELVKTNQDAIFKIEPFSEEELQFDDSGRLLAATIYSAGIPLEVRAQQFIFAAGSGNEIIIKKLQTDAVAMQRRPLHMVMVKWPNGLPLYAHCVGLSARPRLTVTTHYTQERELVWYLGGQLAEEGISRDSATQIIETRKELRALFPWLDFSGAEFSTVMVDRAEPLQKNGMKPEGAYFKAVNNVTIAWPTKLALAPVLAAEICAHIKTIPLYAQWLDLRELRAWPLPPVSMPIWEEAFCKESV